MNTLSISIVVTLVLSALLGLFAEKALSAPPLPTLEDLLKDGSQARILEEMRRLGPPAEQPVAIPRKSAPKRRSVAEIV